MESLNDIKQSIGAMQTDMAVMKANQANMEKTWERAEERIFLVIGEIRVLMVDRFEALEKSLFKGNVG